MSGHTPWRNIHHRNAENPERAQRHEAERRRLERIYNRPWWRARRLLGRLAKRPQHNG
jgi:hypothetical protein